MHSELCTRAHVRFVIATAGVLTILAARPAPAHDIPNAVVVQAFLKPEGGRLHLLVRVPLEAVRDVDVPQRERGFIDLARADQALREAATVWIVREVAMYEEDVRLGDPRLVLARVSLPSDRSFGDYDAALAHLRGPPLPVETDLYWEQGMLDALLEYEIASDRSRAFVHSPSGSRSRCGSGPRMDASGHSSCTTIPASSVSTLDGTRRP
jgi:hypothetical protein